MITRKRQGDCWAVHVERWEQAGKPMQRDIHCTLKLGHDGPHGWELAAPKMTPNTGTYIASRASIPERSEAWRRLRDVDGWKITSTWINEAGIGESADLGALWVRIEAEIAGSERLILYVEVDDFPLKGALIEVGMAIAHRVPIRIVAPGIALEPVSFRPLGSWVRHPLVAFADTMEEALLGATVSM